MRRRRREESRGVNDESDYTHLKFSLLSSDSSAILVDHCLILQVFFPPLRPMN